MVMHKKKKAYNGGRISCFVIVQFHAEISLKY